MKMPKRILMITYWDDFREKSVSLLNNLGYTVKTITHGEYVPYNSLTDFRPDLVIFDAARYALSSGAGFARDVVEDIKAVERSLSRAIAMICCYDFLLPDDARRTYMSKMESLDRKGFVIKDHPVDLLKMVRELLF